MMTKNAGRYHFGRCMRGSPIDHSGMDLGRIGWLLLLREALFPVAREMTASISRSVIERILEGLQLRLDKSCESSLRRG